MARLARDPLYRRGLYQGVGAAIEHEAVAFPRSYNTIIDVGAGIGQFSLFALRKFPAATIYALEPLPDSYRKATAALGFAKRVSLVQAAAGAERRKELIHVTQDRHSSSLRTLTSEQTTQFPGTEATHRIEVQVAPLDELVSSWEIRSPVLLKLDVQGTELDALRGAREFLAHVSEVYVECSFVELYRGQALAHEVIAFLSDSGFVLRGFYSPRYGRDGTNIQADALFSKPGTDPA